MRLFNYLHVRLILLTGILFLCRLSQAQVTDSVDYHISRYNYEKALELLNQDNSKEGWLKKGLVFKSLDQYQEAIACFSKCLAEDSTDVKVRIELATCFESLNNYPAALELLIKVHHSTPENLFVIQKLANVYFQNDQFGQAVDYYQKAALSGDTTYFIAKQLARCYEKMDSVDQAIDYYLKALAFNPADYPSTQRLANIFLKLREILNGLVLTNSFLEIDSTNTKILASNAYFHFLDSSYTKAIDQFERCIALNDTSQFVIKNLGYSYFKNEDYEPAKEYLEKAFWRDSTNAELCYLTGLACSYSVFKKLGIDYIAKSIDMVTPSPQLLSKMFSELGKAHTGFYQYPEALEAFLKALELNDTDPLLVFTIASHYDHCINDKEKALAYYRRFMETRPNNTATEKKVLTHGTIEVSYYEFVQRRIEELEKEAFWSKD